MNKIFVVFIVVVLGVTTLGTLTLLYFSTTGRKEIYADTNKPFSGLGEEFNQTRDVFIIVNRDDPNDITSLTAEEYDGKSVDINKYNITYAPSSRMLAWNTGYVVGLESVAGSEDKYMIIDSGSSNRSKFRILKDVNLEKKWCQTIFSINQSKENETSLLSVEEFAGINSFEKKLELINRGDVVSLIPCLTDNQREAIDENGIVITEYVVIRRTYGTNAVKLSKFIFW